MRVIQHSDAAAFRAKTMPFLMLAEAEHNVILGITERLVTNGAADYDDVFLTHVEDDNGAVVAALMRTAPHGPMFSTKTQAAIPLLVTSVAEVYTSLPTVQGTAAAAQAFAELWQAHSGQTYTTKMEQGLYQLTQVKPPQGVPGECRRATHAEFDLLVDWRIAFTGAVGWEPEPRDKATRYVENRLKEVPTLAIYLWWDGGEPVSMAAGVRLTPNGGVVALVYTPPEQRRKGYASAVTAAVSQILLDHGRQFCCLYTDLANPTSNKIYQAIGYEHITDQRLITFVDVDEEQ